MNFDIKILLTIDTDNFISDKMISDPSKSYDNDLIEKMFYEWCDNLREIYDKSKGLKRNCKGYHRGPIADAPPSVFIPFGEEDETDTQWNNVIEEDYRKGTTTRSRSGRTTVQRTPVTETPKTSTRTKRTRKTRTVLNLGFPG